MAERPQNQYPNQKVRRSQKYGYCLKPIRKIFARNLKRLRKQMGLTQEELAEKMNVSARYLQRLEGKSCPSVGLDTIASLARALKAKPRDFLEE